MIVSPPPSNPVLGTVVCAKWPNLERLLQRNLRKAAEIWDCPIRLVDLWNCWTLSTHIWRLCYQQVTEITNEAPRLKMVPPSGVSLCNILEHFQIPHAMCCAVLCAENILSFCHDFLTSRVVSLNTIRPRCTTCTRDRNKEPFWRVETSFLSWRNDWVFIPYRASEPACRAAMLFGTSGQEGHMGYANKSF